MSPPPPSSSAKRKRRRRADIMAASHGGDNDLKNKHRKTGIGKRLVQAAIEIIATSEGGRVGRAELLAALKEKLPKVCNDSDKDGSGRPKWKGHLDAYSSPTLAGKFFEKGNREWSLTEAGWRWWKSKRKSALPKEPKGGISIPTDSDLTETEDEVATYILNRPTPKDENKGTWFEETVAALLRGMGYGYVHVTKGSWDDGVDVIAYKDDLGIEGARLKVQVKHRKKDAKVDGGVIAQLAHVVREGEVGICVTSSSFNKSAERFVLTSDKHLLLVTRERFAQLWVKYYDRMKPEGQARIPVAVKKKTRRGKNAAD